MTSEVESIYWTALPEALRSIIGDPFSPSASRFEFFALSQKSCSDNDAIEWHDEDGGDPFGLVSAEDEDEAETIAASLAYDLGAFQIRVIRTCCGNDGPHMVDFYVDGMAAVGIESPTHFFCWTVNVYCYAHECNDVRPGGS